MCIEIPPLKCNTFILIKITLKCLFITSVIKLRTLLIQGSLKYCYFLMGNIVIGFTSPLSCFFLIQIYEVLRTIKIPFKSHKNINEVINILYIKNNNAVGVIEIVMASLI